MYISPARICHMYYGLGLTQQQIASRLGVSRISISRLLKQAREDGVVQISIDYSGYYPDLETSLAAAYPGCTFVIADPLDGTDEQIKQSISQTAAGTLPSLTHKATTIAVGWGSTIKQFAGQVEADLHGSVIVPLVGGQVHAGVDLHATSIAESLARRTGARNARLFAPAVAASITEKEQLIASSQVTETLRLAKSADVAIFSVGSPFSASSTLHDAGYYTDEEIAELQASGAECDIISTIYFDATGTPASTELAARTVSLNAQELKTIPHKLCVAGGKSKHLAIELALRAGYCDILVTDAHTGQRLYERAAV